MSLTKEEISEKYFRGTKIKNLKDFEAETPNGNIITGVICKKANHFLGSMLIQKVFLAEKNIEFETEQFIQSMPKIHYYDNKHEMFQDDLHYPVYEKLDGSCLILFGLYYNGEVVEIVPKTRGIPVADKHIISMYNEIDHSNIEAFFEKNKEYNPTLLFELFGTLNQHSIFYPTTRIDINLIGATDEGRFLTWHELNYLHRQYDFKRPKKLFSLRYYKNIWKISVLPGVFFHYLFKDKSKEDIRAYLDKEYPSQYDVIQEIKHMVTSINENYLKQHNRSLLEGVVVNSFNSTGDYLMYLKVKSADIEEKCRTENGVPRRFVLKEVQKYFDEYGSQAKEIYQDNPNHVVDYVNRNLLEEFDVVAVEKKRTQTRIVNVFLDMLEAKEPPKGLQEVCNSLVEEFPDSDISDLMRLFAQKYPEKKRHARIAYSILEKLI